MSTSGIAWIAGLVILLTVAILGYNHFEIKILLGKTGEAKGIITNIEAQQVRGGYIQEVQYEFLIDSKTYHGSKKVGRRYGRQNVGNSVKIKYLSRNPTHNKAVKFYKRVIDNP